MKQTRVVNIKIRVNRDGKDCHSQCPQLVSTDEGWACMVFSRYVGNTRVDAERCEECKKAEMEA